MNVAYVDPPYSRYFERLAARMVARTGGTVTALLSSPAFRVYTGDDSTLVWPAGRCSDPPPVPGPWKFAFWSQTLDDDCRGVFWHAVQWFRACFEQRAIEVCLIFSDARPFSMAAAAAAQELGVRCIYFERGAFRNVTCSISTLGLNARFSLGSARQFAGIDGPGAVSLNPRPTVPWLRWNFLRFILANRVARALSPSRRLIQHKRFALGPYVRLAFAQWRTRHHLNSVGQVTLGPDQRCIVVPLQLPEDSQLRLYSPFENNQAFLDWVAECVRRVAPGVPVLVKRHPMDTRSYRWPEGATVVGGNLARFFRPGAVVVCVNSTVGFEAAVHGVPVLCLAPSFFTEATPLVKLVPPTQFASRLAEALCTPHDAAAGAALRAAVMRWYQAPGDVWAFTEADLDATVTVVLQHVAAARAAAPPLAGAGRQTEARPAVTPGAG
jgi:capsular polysaccharide export protein